MPLQLPHHHDEITPRLFGRMPEREEFEAVAAVLKQLGDSTCLRIFWILCHCEECVTNISALTDMSSPAVSHHLRRLKSAGLIRSRRAGREVYYTVVDSEMTHRLHDAVERLMKMLSCPVLPCISREAGSAGAKIPSGAENEK